MDAGRPRTLAGVKLRPRHLAKRGLRALTDGRAAVGRAAAGRAAIGRTDGRTVRRALLIRGVSPVLAGGRAAALGQCIKRRRELLKATSQEARPAACREASAHQPAACCAARDSAALVQDLLQCLLLRNQPQAL